MTDPMLPPIDPHLEELVASALHDHARQVTAAADSDALRARLAHQDTLVGWRRIGFIGVVIALVAGLLVLGASRRDSEVRTAAGPVTAVAAPRSGPRASGPGGTDLVPAFGGVSGTTSDLSIPLPGDIGPDGATSTTAAPGGDGASTTSTPGVNAGPRPGSPTTSGPTGPGGPNQTTASVPPSTNGPTNAPTTVPAPTNPPTNPSTTAPATTIDPAAQCAAHQVNTEMRLTAVTVGSGLRADFDNGLAPPSSVVTVSSDDTATRRLILSTSTRSDAQGHWVWSISWNASATPYDVSLSFYLQCANGTKLFFTVKRVH